VPFRGSPRAIAYRARVTIAFLPAYIPPDVDINKVKADVGQDSVSAPAQEVPALRQVVTDAKKKGIDLKIVVIDQNPPIETPLRDIATQVGHAYPGSTVLAMSPSFAGAFSPVFDRVTLEAGQDIARTGNPVQSAQNFVGELTTPQFPWTALTIVLIIAVAAATVGARLLQLRSKRANLADSGTHAVS
jgi:hypothetical protein